jgi:hypothetical protein
MKIALAFGIAVAVAVALVLLLLSQAAPIPNISTPSASFSPNIPPPMWGSPSTLGQAYALVGPFQTPPGLAISSVRVNQATQSVMVAFNDSVNLFVFGNSTGTAPGASSPVCTPVPCVVNSQAEISETKVTIAGHPGVEWVGSAASGVGWTSGQREYVLVGALPLKTLLAMARSMGT